MRMALDAAADGKFKSVLELIRDELEAGQRVVVGTYRRAGRERIAEAMSEVAPSAFIHGGVSLTRRPKIIDKLRKTEGPVCLVANIDCIATGVDLTFRVHGRRGRARDGTRATSYNSGESRAPLRRLDEREPVVVRYVIARGTGDELIPQAVINKPRQLPRLGAETDKGDGLRQALAGEDDGLSGSPPP